MAAILMLFLVGCATQSGALLARGRLRTHIQFMLEAAR